MLSRPAKKIYLLILFLIGVGQLHSTFAFFSSRSFQPVNEVPVLNVDQNSTLICHSKVKPQIASTPYKHRSRDHLFSFFSEPFLISFAASVVIFKKEEEIATYWVAISIFSSPPEGPPPKQDSLLT